MEYSQKFIEAEASYELDENFVDAIMALPSMDRVRIIRQVNSSYEAFTSDEENTQMAAGRLGGRGGRSATVRVCLELCLGTSMTLRRVCGTPRAFMSGPVLNPRHAHTIS